MADPWRVFAYAFAAVFLAELGDKTQLAILALSIRGKRSHVLAGAILAFAVVNGLSSALGLLLYELIPLAFLKLAAALAFLAVGIAGVILASLKGEEGTADAPERREGRAGISSAFALVALAELGDKTQLATVSFSALTGSAIPVALAAISALASMTIMTCALGRGLASKLHGRRAELLACAFFLVTGLVMLVLPW